MERDRPESASTRSLVFGEVGLAYLTDVVPEQTPSGRVLRFQAHERYSNPQGRPLHDLGEGPFCRFREPTLPHLAGIYAFVVDGQLALVGDSEDLNQTFNLRFGLISPRECYQGGDEVACRLNHGVMLAAEEGSPVTFWSKVSPNARQNLVRAIARHLADGGALPPWNPPLEVAGTGD